MSGPSGRLPQLGRTLAIVVPLHVIAFALLYLGMLRLVEREVLHGHSDSAAVFAKTLLEDLHMVMVGTSSSDVRQSLAVFSQAHEHLELTLYDSQGRAISTGQAGDESAERVTLPRERGFRIVPEGHDRWRFEGQLDVVAHSQCEDCHRSGELLGVASLSYDITPYMRSAYGRLRRNLGLLVVGWAALVGLITFATRGLVQRSVVRLRAALSDGPRSMLNQVGGVPRLMLDPVSAELYASLAEILRRQQQREADVVSRLHHTDRLASLGQLAAGLAHEIKNPVAGLQGALEILHDETSDPAQRELYEQMLAETRRITATVQSLLHFARPGRPQRVATDVPSFLHDTIQLLTPGLRKRGVKIEVSTAPDLPPFRLDPEQLRQVLVNLLHNAAEAMDSGGTIRVRATAFPEGDGVIIAVEDDGPGMPAEVRERVFEPFFTTKQYGTGLGLAVARTLTARHGGTIEVSSDTGQGSTFMVLLPSAPVTDDDPTVEEG